jgi:hypothetical protein
MSQSLKDSFPKKLENSNTELSDVDAVHSIHNLFSDENEINKDPIVVDATVSPKKSYSNNNITITFTSCPKTGEINPWLLGAGMVLSKLWERELQQLISLEKIEKTPRSPFQQNLIYSSIRKPIRFIMGWNFEKDYGPKVGIEGLIIDRLFVVPFSMRSMESEMWKSVLDSKKLDRFDFFLVSERVSWSYLSRTYGEERTILLPLPVIYSEVFLQNINNKSSNADNALPNAWELLRQSLDIHESIPFTTLNALQWAVYNRRPIIFPPVLDISIKNFLQEDLQGMTAKTFQQLSLDARKARLIASYVDLDYLFRQLPFATFHHKKYNKLENYKSKKLIMASKLKQCLKYWKILRTPSSYVIQDAQLLSFIATGCIDPPDLIAIASELLFQMKWNWEKWADDYYFPKLLHNNSFLESTTSNWSLLLDPKLICFNLTNVSMQMAQPYQIPVGYPLLLRHLSLLQSGVQGCMLLDPYLEATFFWNHASLTLADRLPYKTPWVGIFQHSFLYEQDPYGSQLIFSQQSFLDSLSMCYGLWVLGGEINAQFLKDQLTVLGYSKLPVECLPYPVSVIKTVANFPAKTALFTSQDKNPAPYHLELLHLPGYGRGYPELTYVSLDNSQLESCGDELPIKLHTHLPATLVDNKAHSGSLAELIRPPMFGLTTMSNETHLDFTNSFFKGVNLRMLLQPFLKYYGQSWLASDNANKHPYLFENISQIENFDTWLETISKTRSDNSLALPCVTFQATDGTCALEVIVECHRRYLPIWINGLPEIKAYLGNNYPLYLEENKNITLKKWKETHQYLKQLRTEASVPLNIFLEKILLSTIGRISWLMHRTTIDGHPWEQAAPYLLETFQEQQKKEVSQVIVTHLQTMEKIYQNGILGYDLRQSGLPELPRSVGRRIGHQLQTLLEFRERTSEKTHHWLTQASQKVSQWDKSLWKIFSKNKEDN